MDMKIPPIHNVGNYLWCFYITYWVCVLYESYHSSMDRFADYMLIIAKAAISTGYVLGLISNKYLGVNCPQPLIFLIIVVVYVYYDKLKIYSVCSNNEIVRVHIL